MQQAWETTRALVKVEHKAVPLTGRGGPKHQSFYIFLGNWLTDGGEVVSLIRLPHFTPKNISGIHFC
jgi:hypothetical protein